MQTHVWERFQVTRVRRQVKLDPPKRGKSGRSGAFSVLGDPQVDGQSDGQSDVLERNVSVNVDKKVTAGFEVDRAVRGGKPRGTRRESGRREMNCNQTAAFED
ncbi:hypothetical protein CCH79_00004268 [Gambusia affinis]|uniref:Uncharacterized protein n=1 Tax=Gambusia affinis TaxID=33528 RepID=A0A315V4E4_GAMAF|nr:hypothetical protein CCH79_00004268 [Gambusia affinis]